LAPEKVTYWKFLFCKMLAHIKEDTLATAYAFLFFCLQEIKSVLPNIACIVVTFIELEESLIDLVPIYGVKDEIVPCSIQGSEAYALPAMSQSTRESLAFLESFVPSLESVLFAIQHYLKEGWPSLILCTPVTKAFGLIFWLFEKKPPGWRIRNLNRAVYVNSQSTTPTTLPA
jgi:hypothetical protein